MPAPPLSNSGCAPAASVWLWEERRGLSEHEPGAAEAPTPANGRADDGLDLRDRLRFVLQPPLGLCLALDGVLEWPHELMPFQVQGVRLLFERDRLLLADDYERAGQRAGWQPPTAASISRSYTAAIRPSESGRSSWE